MCSVLNTIKTRASAFLAVAVRSFSSRRLTYSKMATGVAPCRSGQLGYLLPAGVGVRCRWGVAMEARCLERCHSQLPVRSILPVTLPALISLARHRSQALKGHSRRHRPFSLVDRGGASTGGNMPDSGFGQALIADPLEEEIRIFSISTAVHLIHSAPPGSFLHS